MSPWTICPPKQLGLQPAESAGEPTSGRDLNSWEASGSLVVGAPLRASLLTGGTHMYVYIHIHITYMYVCVHISDYAEV